MNHIIHNISIIILTVGIIMMVVYVTKASNNNFLTTEQMLMQRRAGQSTVSEETVYDYKVSKAYKKMMKKNRVMMKSQNSPQTINLI